MNQIPDVSTLSADDYPNIEAVQVDSAYWDEQQHAKAQEQAVLIDDEAIRKTILDAVSMAAQG